MNKHDLEKFYIWFEKFLDNFNSKDKYIQQSIIFKKDHTLRVSKNIKNIGEKLNLSKSYLFLAESVALFHDLGRFEQIFRYKSLNDADTINHAYLSVEILKKNNILKNISSDEKDIIYNAIKLHNTHHLPDNLPLDILLFSKLIRDADKLDIFHSFYDIYKNENLNKNPILMMNLSNNPKYSLNIINDILNNDSTSVNNLKTINDFRLLLLSWVFDLYFPQTLKIILDHNYIDNLIKLLPDDKQIKQIDNYIKRYIEKRQNY